MTIEIGAAAPPFALVNHAGEEVTLSRFAGKWLVLWFFPKADTPG